MSESDVPRDQIAKRRDEIADVVTAARDRYSELPGRIIVVSEDQAIADALIASFDITAPALPENLNAENLRKLAQPLRATEWAGIGLQLDAWADRLGRLPADEKTPRVPEGLTAERLREIAASHRRLLYDAIGPGAYGVSHNANALDAWADVLDGKTEQ